MAHEFDLVAAQVAYLFALGKTQKGIAAELKIHPSTVSRKIKVARDLGFLRFVFEPTGIPDEALPAVYGMVEDRDLCGRLRQIGPASGVRVRRVWVFPEGNRRGGDYADGLGVFGHWAADIVRERLRDVDSVGITYGETLLRVIKGLERIPSRRLSPGLRVVPLCGEFRHHVSHRNATQDLTVRLARALGGTSAVRSFSSDRRPLIPRRELREGRHAGDGFHGGEPVLPPSAVLTSISVDNRPYGPHYEEFLELAEIPAERLGKLAVGDFGGVLLHRGQMRPEDNAEFRDLLRMWTGIRGEEFEGIARRAEKRDEGGVFVIAMWENKAETLYQVLCRGWVNELIIDESLACAIGKILDARRKPLGKAS